MPMGFGYKGLIKTGEGSNAGESNQLRLSSISKGETSFDFIFFIISSFCFSCFDRKIQLSDKYILHLHYY